MYYSVVYIFCRAFGYDHLRPDEVQQMYGEARMMDEQHGHEFTGKKEELTIHYSYTSCQCGQLWGQSTVLTVH